MVEIDIRSPKDMKKVQKSVLEVTNSVQLTFYKRVNSVVGRITQFIVRSLRSRLAAAPYSAKSKRPGPWSRRGGRPSEKSIRARIRKNTYTIYIENKGNVRGRGVLKPSEYLQISGRGPKHHVDEAVEKAISTLFKILDSM